MDKIFKRKGITLKNFIFTAVLISSSVIISFGVLYFTLPDYYFYMKNKSIKENTDVLVEKIRTGGSGEEIRQIIIDFSAHNNANVLTFSKDNGMLVNLSTPFTSLYIKDADVPMISVSEKHSLSEGGDDEIYTSVIYVDENRAFFAPISIQTQEVSGRATAAAARLPQASIITIEKKLDHEYIDRIVVTGTLQPIDEAKTVIISLAPYLLLANILLALTAAYFYSRQMTKPIVALSEAAAKMRLMAPGVVSGIRRNDELGELSENLDLMYLSLCDNIENLRNEMEKVSVLEKSKTDLMRAASHELKTPLAALNGVIEGMIDNVGKYKDRDKYLRECKKLTDSLAKLTGEILRASKLDTAENIIQLEKVDISELISATLEKYHIFIEEKKINVTFKKEEVWVTTDANILGNALSNIVSNAVKYTNDGGIILIGIERENERYAITVENKCESVSDSVLPKLFEPFYTLSYSRNRIKSGTGLGLYIVKRNLETLHLKYKLENTKLGLKFSIFLGEA